MKKETQDTETNTEEDFITQELDKLREQLTEEKEKAIAHVSTN